MPVVEEVIPDAFAAEAEAARLWFTREQSTEFKLTAIVNPQDVLAHDSTSGARELQLILCGQQEGQDVCLRERFEIKPDGDGFDVTPAAWVAAFSVLPLWIPTLALAGWIAKITPGVRTINRRFQNVGPNENPA